MFDTAAGQVLAAVRRWTSGQESGTSPRNEWSTIRKLCKDVIVCLDSHGQYTLAARVEREYQQLKATCNAAEEIGDARARHRFLDAAEELHSTLDALSRFQSHLSAAPNRQGKKEDDAANTNIPHRRSGRKIETEQRLMKLFSSIVGKYRRMGEKILGGDLVAKKQFCDEYGSLALARKWAAEEGRPHDQLEITRWGSAIRESPFYTRTFQPFTGREVRVPEFWHRLTNADLRYDDIIREATRLSEEPS